MAMPPPYQPSPSYGGRLDVGAAFSYGWAKFTQNAGTMIVATLLVWAAGFVVNLIAVPFDNQIARFLFSVVSFIVGQVMTRGLVRSALVVLNGGRPEPGSVFTFDNIVPYIVGAILFGLAVSVGLVLCIIPGIIIGALLALWPFACVEQDLDGVSAIKRSLELTKPHFGSMLLFGIGIFVLNLVGLLLCGVGLLATIPMTYIATGHVYRQLSGGPVAA